LLYSISTDESIQGFNTGGVSYAVDLLCYRWVDGLPGWLVNCSIL